MNNKSIMAGVALLSCVAVTSFSVQAADAPEQTVTQSKDNMRDLNTGDRAPEKFQRPDAAIKDWKQKGLKAPAKESQWVRINDRYVQVQITNGQVTEIAPVTK